MKKIFIDLIGFLFPRFCPSCKKRLTAYEKHVCLDCLALLPKTGYHLEKDNKLEKFFAGRIPFERVASFVYFAQDGIIQKIIHELKYHNNPEIGVFIGELCGEHMKDSSFMRSIDCIVPIPLHPKRQKKRGYNQSLEIAKGIASKTGITIDSETVVRTQNNSSQAKSTSRFERWDNVENIFSLTSESAFSGKHILLLDDVLTTGSTIEACAKEILKSDNCKISILSIASIN